MKVILIITLSMLFTGFTETQKFNGMVSIDSKHSELEEFYELLSDFKNHKPVTIETKHRKNRIMNNVNQLCDNYYDSYKNNYDSEELNEQDKMFFDPNQFKIFDEKNQKPKSTEENTERCESHYGLK